MRKNGWIILLFIVGLSVLVYPYAAQWLNDYFQKQQVHEFMQNASEKSNEDIDEMMAEAKACNEEIYYNSAGFQDPFSDREEKFQSFKKCLGIHDEAIFGAIEIPKLKLLIPIYLGATDEILNNGIGQVEGSSIPIGGKSSHTVLAGHRGMGTKEMFRNIDELHNGDVFYVHTMSETLTYRVKNQQIIYPHETESLEIEEGKDLATLLTCHPYRHDYQRLLIQGERDK
ncbi:class C sortase [Lederbergia lenta]|uniref:Sortase n=1 Tax=Lederbergia lenta TaxID=1467 RepID=A0A2X4WDE5_LEDLE|nr:class C sortase [Lederbergia lenta]MEC2323112.1 class C sortase [Lederbergia lenta]SQI62747.1 sortase [Lederbergia lenta]